MSSIDFFSDFYKKCPETENVPFVNLGLAYIKFASEYPNLFRLLFIDGANSGMSMYDLINGGKNNFVIHEIKKSDKVEEAHHWQLKYYMFVLERNGIEGVTGVLEYPTLRQTETVVLNDNDREVITKMEKEIEEIIHAETCPPVIHARLCKNCSYYDFCYVGE